MLQDTQNLELNQVEMLSLEQVAQVGARQMLALAVHAEIQSYLASFAGLHTSDGHQAVVRNGYHPPGRLPRATVRWRWRFPVVDRG